MNNERKTLVSIPVWGILLIILMIISVIVLVKTFIDLKKEPVEITDTTYMDEPVLDLIDKVDDFLMNNTVVTETVGVPNSLTYEDRKEIYDAANKRTEDRKNSIVYVNKVHDQMAVKIVEEEARNLLTEYIKEYIMFENNELFFKEISSLCCCKFRTGVSKKRDETRDLPFVIFYFEE